MQAATILLADDEAHITCIVSQKLRSAGFSVVVARDGEEAYELACRVKPALVVTDLQMPRMSGLELAIKLKKTEGTSATPVVMLTARGYIVDNDAMAQTNIRHVMAKPFSAQAILRKATELIGVPGGCGSVEAA